MMSSTSGLFMLIAMVTPGSSISLESARNHPIVIIPFTTLRWFGLIQKLMDAGQNIGFHPSQKAAADEAVFDREVEVHH